VANPRVSNILLRLARHLFSSEAHQDRFISSLMNPVEKPTAVVWTETRPETSPFLPDPSVSWQPDYVDFVSIDQRPGKHDVHSNGDIYCLDPSSVFASQVLTAVPKTHSIIDLCASPGGKAVLAWRRLKPQHLLCNEVIAKRTGALISNLKRCRIRPVQVCSLDSKVLADQVGAMADLVIVDTPCSGQSLIARGKKSPGCFHPATINMNSNRQRRILSNAVKLVAPGGYLAYMTCTYAIKENERNLDWLLKKNPQLQPVKVPLLTTWQSEYSDTACYRLWPFDSVGAGAFAALLRSDVDEGAGTRWHWPRVVWDSENNERSFRRAGTRRQL
jgi:16S rRNA C967 or C1407 C5-methylase (RsmB/RsmF family)